MSYTERLRDKIEAAKKKPAVEVIQDVYIDFSMLNKDQIWKWERLLEKEMKELPEKCLKRVLEEK